MFLDLNGTLVTPIKVEHLNELAMIEGVDVAVARLTRAGFVCPVVTIQSRIAKGLFSVAQFEEWFGTFAAALHARGAELAGPYVCPHRFADPCVCKKPHTVLYERAAAELGLDLPRSFVIGDSARDIEAATRFGGKGVLVRTGWAHDEGEVTRSRPYAAFVAQSLGAAVDWVLAQQPHGRTDASM